MPEMTNEELADAAVEIAQEIERLIRGKPTVAVYLAVGMVLGVAERQSKRPDVEGLITIMRRGIEDVISRKGRFNA